MGSSKRTERRLRLEAVGITSDATVFGGVNNTCIVVRVAASSVGVVEVGVSYKLVVVDVIIIVLVLFVAYFDCIVAVVVVGHPHQVLWMCLLPSSSTSLQRAPLVQPQYLKLGC